MAGRALATGARGACPGCGAPILPAPERRSIGKPFLECAACGAFVPRRGANEWDLLPGAERMRHLARALVLALAAGAAAWLVYVAYAFGQGRGSPPRESLAIFVTGVLAAGLVLGARLSEAIRRSRRRLGDPMYRARLVEFELRMQRGSTEA